MCLLTAGHFKAPPLAEGLPDIRKVLAHYVNAGLCSGLTPDWGLFRKTSLYARCIAKFTTETVDQEIGEIQKQTDLLAQPNLRKSSQLSKKKHNDRVGINESQIII
jgi:hypothetical protein